jgi:hypothetical protein
MNPEFHERREDDFFGGAEPSRDADDVRDLESLLRRMPLRPPGAALDRRVLATCRRPATRRRLMWAAAAAAVIVAAGAAPIVTYRLTRRAWDSSAMTLRHDPPAATIASGRGPQTTIAPAARAAASAGPVRIERTLSGGFSSDGVVGVADRAPLQRFRRLSIRQVWIVDPRNGTRVAVTIPREEVVLVRVQPF